jgi:tRNA modification GTPase
MCNKYNLLSCKTEHGLTELLSKLSDVIEETMPDMSSGLVVTSSRHKAKLASSLKSLRNARRNIERHASPELTAADLRECISAIDEITGRVYTEEILGRIFSKFCIGK